MKFLEAVILCSFSSLLLVGVVLAQDITEVITESEFEQMLLHRNDVACPARGFYTYDAFIKATRFYPAFGNTGDLATRRREVAAFFGQTSQETTGGWDTAPDGRYAWGYCFNKETPVPGGCCVANAQWPCVQGQTYCGRGPIQLTYNFNYGPAGEALGLDLLANPDLVSSDTVISFEAALWFWMTPQPPKPSCHDVITGQWTPSQADIDAGRVPGYGVITNIINGGIECGRGPVPQMLYRIGFYERFCGILGTSTGDNLDCANQRHFGNVLVKDQPVYSSFPIEMVVA